MSKPHHDLVFRPDAPEDESFLRRLILETLTEQLFASSWPDAVRERLLETQYQVHLQGFRSTPNAAGRIVLSEGQPVGWYVAADLDQELRLVNIMVLASHRGRGLGAGILQELIADAERSRKPVRLEVNARNHGAIRLYIRLGFQRVGGGETHHVMERPPSLSIPQGMNSGQKYQMYRIFCAAPRELESERRTFYDLVGNFNDTEAARWPVLFIPVSVNVNVRDKRPLQYDVDQNIRACRHYIQLLADDWGPPERNFEADFRLAVECAADPCLPMAEVAAFVRRPSPVSLPEGVSKREFSGSDDFKFQLSRLLSDWLALLADEVIAANRNRTAL